jgi:glycosyltransferase involved in cell wall biosynthesis
VKRSRAAWRRTNILHPVGRDKSTVAATGAAPLRVLIVTSEWPTPDRPFDVPFIVRQVEFLRRAGVVVDVFAFRGRRRLANYIRAWRQLQHRLGSEAYDLVHAHFGQSAALAWPRRVPLVVTFHGSDLQGIKGSRGQVTVAGRLLQRVSRNAARRADAVIVVAEPMLRFLPSSITAHVIPAGVDLEQIPCIPQAEARRRLGMPASERLVLFVGDPAKPVKRYDLAQRAVDVLVRRCPARLILGWEMLPEEILVLMSACDVLLITSRHEGSPTIVKEALACNLPIVSLDVGDVRARTSGVEGCEICPDDRPETIAASLERTIRNHRRTRGREAVRHLDERIVIGQVLDVYRSVLPCRTERSAVRVSTEPDVSGGAPFTR